MLDCFSILIASFYIVPFESLLAWDACPKHVLVPLCLFVLLSSDSFGWLWLGTAAAKDRGLFVIVGLSTIALFALSMDWEETRMNSVTTASFALTIVFLPFTCCVSVSGQLGMLTKKKVALLFVGFRLR